MSLDAEALTRTVVELNDGLTEAERRLRDVTFVLCAILRYAPGLIDAIPDKFVAPVDEAILRLHAFMEQPPP